MLRSKTVAHMKHGFYDWQQALPCFRTCLVLSANATGLASSARILLHVHEISQVVRTRATAWAGKGQKPCKRRQGDANHMFSIITSDVAKARPLRSLMSLLLGNIWRRAWGSV